MKENEKIQDKRDLGASQTPQRQSEHNLLNGEQDLNQEQPGWWTLAFVG